jgi:hypothetical protein
MAASYVRFGSKADISSIFGARGVSSEGTTVHPRVAPLRSSAASVSAKASFASGLAVKDGRNVLPVETQNESDVREAQQALTARL